MHVLFLTAYLKFMSYYCKVKQYVPSSVPTKIVIHPEYSPAELDVYVLLNCEATSDDSTPITIEWEYNDEPFKYESNHREKLNNGSLLILKEIIGQEGEEEYTCIANNGYHYTKSSVDLVPHHGSSTSKNAVINYYNM
jgi:hypothetical protein